MTPYQLFRSINEPFAAGLFENAEDAPIPRYANALKRFFEDAPLPPYGGGGLYPCGVNLFNYGGDYAVRPHYANTYRFDEAALEAKSPEACRVMREEAALVKKFSGWPHTVGGMGWTHSFPNYERILREGLGSYRKRVDALPEGDFRRGMLTLLEGIDIYHRRCVEMLEREGAPSLLTDTMRRIPYEPVKNLYEAILSLNFIYYIDGCDDVGHLDRILLPYYRGEDATPTLREFFKNVDENDGWSGALGPEYNEITRMCLRAIKGIRRPSLQLLVKPDMPDWVWEESAAALESGCGQPAMYNYGLYMSEMRSVMPEIPNEDLDKLAFGGCTETMLEGISAVGSDDAGLNVALVFSEYMRSALPHCQSYREFYAGLAEALDTAIGQTVEKLNEYRRTRALYRPSVMRTLLVEDCLDSMKDFNDGGARWIWSCINNAGLINVIDSLSVIKNLVYVQGRYSGEELIRLMDERDPEFLALAAACPMHGNDSGEAEEIGAELIGLLTDAYGRRSCYPRGRFLPVSNQFTTYAREGHKLPATPDGRAAGDPLCDSLGAIHGNDYKGPTAMLTSVAKLGAHRFIGTPITNLRLSREHLRPALRPLVLGFFEKGGMQLQISCISKEDMLDAMKHPERHGSLMVRIGGFCEYFVRLPEDLQLSVLARTEH